MIKDRGMKRHKINREIDRETEKASPDTNSIIISLLDLKPIGSLLIYALDRVFAHQNLIKILLCNTRYYVEPSIGRSFLEIRSLLIKEDLHSIPSKNS